MRYRVLIVSTIVYRLCEGVSDFQGGGSSYFVHSNTRHWLKLSKFRYHFKLTMKNQAVFLYKLINQEMGVSPPPFFSRKRVSHATLNSRFSWWCRIQKESSSIQTKICSFTWVSRHNTFIKTKQNSKQTNFSTSIYTNMYVFNLIKANILLYSTIF